MIVLDPNPVLITERLILRLPRVEDLDAVTAFVTSDRTAFIGGPIPAYAARTYLDESIRGWFDDGYGWWMIEHRDTGRVAGRTGIGHPDGTATLELGWHIYDGFEGQGLAFEAAHAARAHAQGVWAMRGIVSLIDPGNFRSKRLATRLGARFDRMGTIEGDVCEVWLHPEGVA